MRLLILIVMVVSNRRRKIFKYCKICPIRKCARERKVKSCAFCSDYPCEELLKLFKGYPKAKENLETLRRKRNVT